MTIRLGSGMPWKKNTTTSSITPPQRPPRRTERRHDGSGGSRSARPVLFAPFLPAAAFGFSGFFSRISDASTSTSLPSSS